ncbi:MAG: peroxidase-related enzyme [Alphaproteobacteria bacterium]|jgi:uncharacterized peroxidase-related enzyme
MARSTKPGKTRANPVHALRLPNQRRLDPAIKTLFAKFTEKLGFVPNVFRSYTLRPRRLEHFRQYNNELMVGDSGLTKLEREMIAVVVSSVNHCHYCLVAHGAAVRVLSGNTHLSDQLAANYRSSEVTPRQRAMLDFVWKLSATPALIEESDRAALRHAGFSDEDIFDIAEVAAFYAASNRLASAVDARPNPEYYKMGR